MKISFGKDRCGNPPRYLGKLPGLGGMPARSENGSGDVSRLSTETSFEAENESVQETS